jgi:hypothetical protein
MLFRRMVSVTLWALLMTACAQRLQSPPVSRVMKDASTEITGRVIDTHLRGPVKLAAVEILGTRLTSRTDSEGQFSLFGHLSAGCHRLLVRAIGYGLTEVRFASADSVKVNLSDVPLRAAAIPETRLLLLNGCDAGPLTAEDAPWGVDTFSVK